MTLLQFHATAVSKCMPVPLSSSGMAKSKKVMRTLGGQGSWASAKELPRAKSAAIQWRKGMAIFSSPRVALGQQSRNLCFVQTDLA
jgi:hypothetical protein